MVFRSIIQPRIVNTGTVWVKSKMHLFNIVIGTYSAEVNFEDTTQIHDIGETVAFKVLDFWLVASFDDVSVVSHVRNEAGVWLKDLSCFEKRRFPPCFGTVGEMTERLASYFSRAACSMPTVAGPWGQCHVLFPMPIF